jgi:hypothetical protein
MRTTSSSESAHRRPADSTLDRSTMSLTSQSRLRPETLKNGLRSSAVWTPAQAFESRTVPAPGGSEKQIFFRWNFSVRKRFQIELAVGSVFPGRRERFIWQPLPLRELGDRRPANCCDNAHQHGGKKMPGFSLAPADGQSIERRPRAAPLIQGDGKTPCLLNDASFARR